MGHGDIIHIAADARFRRRMVDAHYTEAMLLADEARSYFESGGAGERDRLDPVARVAFACESLKVTTRLMHVIAWLLTRRAVAAGELDAAQLAGPAHRLGEAVASDDAATAALSLHAQGIIAASIELFEAVARLDEAEAAGAPENPALALHARLAAAF